MEGHQLGGEIKTGGYGFQGGVSEMPGVPVETSSPISSILSLTLFDPFSVC